MATKRLVPRGSVGGNDTFEFADGSRQIPEWERVFLEDALVVDLTGKHLIELTYQQWQEQVFSVMQVRNQFVGEVLRQRHDHFVKNSY